MMPPSKLRLTLVCSWALPSAATSALLLLLASGSGCRRDDVAVYDAPKDAPAPAPSHAHASPGMGMGSMPDQVPPRPSLQWKTLPEGWTDKGASGMRAANFSISTSAGAPADLAVIPLPGTGGSDLDLVNLWRGQLGLQPIPESELGQHTEETKVGDDPVRLFTIVGSSSADASANGNQILVAAVRKGGFTWFFKLGGTTAAVEAARPGLKSLLSTVEFGQSATPMPPMMAAGALPAVGSASTGPNSPMSADWDVPAGWSAVEAPQMVHRKWTMTVGNASADITISVFPGETGGLVANVNRWRGQVGLGPQSESELQAALQSIDVMGGSATLVDFTGSSPESGDPARIIAAIVKRDGNSWFYKILGAPAVVDAQRDAFVRFVQSAKYAKRS